MTTEQRLESMERQLVCMKRFNRWLLVAVGLIVGGWGMLNVGGLRPNIMAQAAEADGKTEKVIRANKFIVENEMGKVRAELSMNKEGPVFFLNDANDKPRITMGIQSEGATLNLCDENGIVRAMLCVKKGESVLSMFNEEGNPRAGLTVSKDGPRLNMFGESNNATTTLEIRERGPRLFLTDKKGTFWSTPKW
ncbi:MAG: hypothetical protein V1809_01980 [Planctomycetota bacterium]